MKKFLVVRTDRIGDLLLSTPVIYEIKRKIESSFVAVLTNNYAKEILFNNSDVDLIYSIDDKNVYKNIKMQNFDTAIVLYPRFLISLKILLCDIPERIGTAFRWYSPLFFNKKIKLHRKNSGMHEADLNLLMIKDIIGETKAKKLFYYPMEAERIRADEYLVKNNIKEFIMIFIGGRGSADNLSPEKYADIASAIKEKFNKKIIIGYGLDEYDKIKRFKLKLNDFNDIHILEQPFKIRDLAALIEQADLFISGSTGPMHIAAALGKKTLTFFPNKGALPDRWGPIGNKHEIIQPEKDKKMDDILVELILEKISNLLKK